jgi:hypothetical protein
VHRDDVDGKWMFVLLATVFWAGLQGGIIESEEAIPLRTRG